MQTGVQRSTSAAGDLVCKPPLSCCQRMLDPAGRRGITGQCACLVNRRSWVRIPAVPLEGVLEHHLGLSGFFYPRTECKRGCRVAPVPQAIWFANHPSACRLAPWLSWLKRLLVVNRRSWVRIPAVPLEGELEHHLGLSVFFLSENGMPMGVQRSASAAGDLVCKPPLSCCQRMLDPAGRRGITGQCACLVNRRSWVRIPAVPLEGVLEHHLGLSGFSIRERNANGCAE